MDSEQIAHELRQFVRTQFAVPQNDRDFSDDVDLFNYGYIDSLGAVELAHFIERQFGVTFTSSDWATASLDSIRNISGFVASRTKKPQ